MPGILVELSQLILNPATQVMKAQIIVGLPVPPPPTKPPKMEVTMQISKEMEKQQKEASKGIVEEPKDPFKEKYFEHLEGGLNVNVDEVAIDEEKSQSLDEDAEALSENYIIETFDQDLE